MSPTPFAAVVPAMIVFSKSGSETTRIHRQSFRREARRGAGSALSDTAVVPALLPLIVACFMFMVAALLLVIAPPNARPPAPCWV